MAEQEAAQVDEQAETTDAASAEDSGIAGAVDERAAELTGGASSDDQPIAEINRPAVDAATEHLDDVNLADDRETLKKLQQGM
jgi:hypothetical protein